MIYLSDENYEEVMSKGNVVVDFYADWCGPCQMFGPIFENVSKKNTNFTFVKCDVDKASRPAAKFGVRSIPTIIVLKDGKLVNSALGAMDENSFEEFLNSSK